MASPVQTPDDLATRLHGWVGLGLISRAQADRILAVERGEHPAPPRRPASILAEALGYVGGVLILVATFAPLIVAVLGHDPLEFHYDQVDPDLQISPKFFGGISPEFLFGVEPVNGRAAIAERINALGAGIESITLHIRNIGVIGEVVVIERVDEFVYNGHHGKVPVVGVLQVEGDKVKEWREYYDRAELLAEMGVAPRVTSGASH